MTTDDPAHSLNTPGPFYVCAGCCTLCGVPEFNAPDLFSVGKSEGSEFEECFVKAQPQSDAELNRMLEVVGKQELGCVRYRGRDPEVIRRLNELGEGQQVDGASAGAPTGHQPRKIDVARQHAAHREAEIAKQREAQERAEAMRMGEPGPFEHLPEATESPAELRQAILWFTVLALVIGGIIAALAMTGI